MNVFLWALALAALFLIGWRTAELVKDIRDLLHDFRDDGRRNER